MGAMTMEMSGYTAEVDSSQAAEYGDEVMCAGWIPCLAMQPYSSTKGNRHTSLTINLAKVDVEMFLNRMYAFQR